MYIYIFLVCINTTNSCVIHESDKAFESAKICRAAASYIAARVVQNEVRFGDCVKVGKE